MNVFSIVMLVIIALFVIAGFHAGMVKKLNSILSLFAAAFLVSFMLPQVTQVIKDRTPVYTYIEGQCGEVLEKQAGKLLGMTDEIPVLNQLGQIQQTQLIRSLPVPAYISRMLLNYNNAEGYKKLGVSDFGSYLSHFLADVILNIASFLVTLVLVRLILLAIMSALNLFASLPVLRLVNRLGGALLGLLQGVVAVWVILLLISLFSGTTVGMKLSEMADESAILAPIYETNLLLALITRAVKAIL